MKKILYILCVLLQLSLPVLSEGSVWKVTQKKQTLYLGGTIQILRPADFPLPKEYELAYDDSNLLVLEGDVMKASEPSVGTEVIKRMMYTDDSTLCSVLNDKIYVALHEKMLKYPLAIENIEKYRPEMAILIMKAIAMQQQSVAAVNMDEYFQEKAQQECKNIDFLHNTEELIKALVYESAGYEDQYIQFALDGLYTIEKDISVLISSWRDGYATFMTSWIIEMQRLYPELYQSMLANKTRTLLLKAQAYMHDKETVPFLLLNDMYLHGPDGLLNLLQEKGYKVKQLQADKKRRKFF